VSERPDSDPSNNAIRPPYTAAFNSYVRTELGFKSDLEYYILGGGIGRWDWGVNNGYADTSEMLRNAFAKNPYLKLFVACGYYDQAHFINDFRAFSGLTPTAYLAGDRARAGHVALSE